MALRRAFAIPVAALALVAACKGKDKDGSATPKAIDLEQRCAQLARGCGDKDKHVGKLVEECTALAAKQTAEGCPAKVSAAYDCFEKELCGKGEPVWSLDDMRVLADRHKKCVAERDAASACTAK